MEIPFITPLNIFGLAISISACWIIYRIVDYGFSYDKNVAGKENIYRLVTGFVFYENQSYNALKAAMANPVKSLRTE